MITTKQRAQLRALANPLEVILQVGKGGISENMINSFSEALEARELIKISVLNNTDESARDIAIELAEQLNAEVVEVIGKKIVLYRKSSRKGFDHVKF